MNIQIIYLCAGLANRMFQYALYLSLQNRGYKVLIADNSKVTIYKHENVNIQNIFPNIIYKKASHLCIFLMGGSNDIFCRFLRNRLHLYSPFYAKSKAEEGFNSYILSPSRPLYHAGVFQSEKYFEDIKEQIRQAFTFKPFEQGKNLYIQNKMSSENSIAIHIRKGNDYLNGEPYKNTCEKVYYIKAIEYIKRQVKDPVFYVFTDNPTWVKQNLKDEIAYILIDWNPAIGEGNHFDMQLMSCAKHNIIANSTYSWWGAWLNPNSNKIVIGPRQWFNPLCKKFNEIDDLMIIPNDWIKI